MLTQICQYLRNWFDRDRFYGTYLVSGGVLTYADGSALPLASGQYFRVVGSLFNDGVHKLGDAEDILTDEPEFAGAVWSMAVPPVVIALDADIDKWCEDNAAALTSPYASESFGGYSYTMRSTYSPSGGSSQVSWESVFAAQLAPWRKM